MSLDEMVRLCERNQLDSPVTITVRDLLRLVGAVQAAERIVIHNGYEDMCDLMDAVKALKGIR